MKLLIFGASGHTGRELVRQALERGHSVTAFVRQPSKLSSPHPQLQVIQGDVGDTTAVREAVRNQDAVVSALGVGTPLKHDLTVIDGVRHIVQAMEADGPRRFLYLSFIGVAESRAAVGVVLRYIAPIPLREEIADHEAKEKLVRSSTLDWTIVRPPKLTNGPRTGKYRSGETIRTLMPLPTLSRADVADFMLRELETPAHVRGTPRILR
jgi:putative NADH-flavin reductase